MLTGPNQHDAFQIVGVVADTNYNTLGEDARMLVYRLFRQASSGAAIDRNAVIEPQTMRDSLAFALMPGRMAAIVLGRHGSSGIAARDLWPECDSGLRREPPDR
jgi:hypothetical protein